MPVYLSGQTDKLLMVPDYAVESWSLVRKVYMRLKENLSHLIKLRGLTASGLARVSNTPKQTLADWLMGASPKDLRAVKRVADALMVSMDALCFADLQKDASEFERRLGEIRAGQFEVVLRRIKPGGT